MYVIAIWYFTNFNGLVLVSMCPVQPQIPSGQTGNNLPHGSACLLKDAFLLIVIVKWLFELLKAVLSSNPSACSPLTFLIAEAFPLAELILTGCFCTVLKTVVHENRSLSSR